MNALQEAQSLPILVALLALVCVLGAYELARHQRRLTSIPIRVHVNGTRGKSSVTRLIGAGLRAGGIRTLVKVTGTFPKLVLENGDEIDIFRRNGANILEQLDIVRFAADRKAEALVIECMALEPRFQWIAEHRIVQSTLGVLTNVRLDHCDVMGQSLDEIADALGGTIPQRGHLISGERRLAAKVGRLASRRHCRTEVTDPSGVTREDMDRFSYLEHEENVALALGVCRHLGVDRETALNGMVASEPDSGALTRSTLQLDDRSVVFYNAFAANDPDSTLRIWKRLSHADDGGEAGDKSHVLLLNTREDRADRSRQLGELVAEHLATDLDRVVLMGTGTHVAQRHMGSAVAEDRITDLGTADAAEIAQRLLELSKGRKETVIFAVGNMAGAGAATVELFAAFQEDYP